MATQMWGFPATQCSTHTPLPHDPHAAPRVQEAGVVVVLVVDVTVVVVDSSSSVPPQPGNAGFVAFLHAVLSVFFSVEHSFLQATPGLRLGQEALHDLASLEISCLQGLGHLASVGEAVRTAPTSSTAEANGRDDTRLMQLAPVGVCSVLSAHVQRQTERMASGGAMALAALAGLVRWTVMAHTTSLAALALVQRLHGFTFALLHLACMRLIAAMVPPHLVATAQSIYAAGATAMVALLTLVSGTLYARFGPRGFLVMALLCAVALPVARGLRASPTAFP